MKSLAELQAIRDKMKQQVFVRENDDDNIRVVVGMATCGIAAGARPVLAAFTDEVAKRNLHNVRKTVDKSRILRFYIYVALPRKIACGRVAAM